MKKINYFKTITFSLMTLMSMGMFTACGSDDDDNNNNVQPQSEAQADDDNNPGGGGSQPSSEVFHPINASTRTLIDIVEENEYEPTKFGGVIAEWPMLSVAGDGIANLMKPALKAMVNNRLPQMDELFKERVGTAEDCSRQWNLKRYVFTYKTVSSTTGNDTTLMGSVIFPTNTVGKQHQVDVLTLYHHQLYLEESWQPSRAVTLMGMHALHNSAVIEPDGHGSTFGLNEMYKVGIAMLGDMSALQMADCILAALEVMKQNNVTLAADGYTNNWGTSLGTFGATGFARYMDVEAPADLKQLIRLRASFIGEGATMANQFKVYHFADPVPQKFHYGWNPHVPFYIATNPDDEMISYDELKNYYTALRTMPDESTNVKVHWIDYQLPSLIQKIVSSEQVSQKIYGLGNHMLSSLVMLYASCTVNDPADMEKALNKDHFSSKK